MEILTSVANPFIKRLRSLKQKKGRAELGAFLAEGAAHVGAALEADWEIASVVYAPDLLTSPFAKELLIRAEKRGIRVQPVSRSVMESLAEKEHPQGILAEVKQRRVQLADIKSAQKIVVLVSPQDPGNVGTILRTMDAVGADALFLLDGGVELFHPSVVRASMGALFWKPTAQTSFEEFIQWARERRVQCVGTSAKAQADYRAFVPQAARALILGTEQKGLSAEQLSVCDATVSLPMRGRVSSLNLSVAAGVLLYQFMEN
ncbi:MAG: RNA methyltransferase [Anaerolineales bacterium]|nr:RNA methyltransferase [Anaerolineales bacterium]